MFVLKFRLSDFTHITPAFSISSALPLHQMTNGQRVTLDTGRKDGNKIAATGRMKERNLTLPEIGLMAGTRVALGAGIGLLISDRLNKDQRKAAGLALFGVGVLTTVPIVAGILGKGPLAHRRIGLAA
jgi:hypothetical protein